ncbi:MAG: hypothetical protein GF334_02480 [Candidatus Altiarchaeales archaeon]|nr:hypothetical protein [Candidatus Altiarchaeales archaeon]
MSLLRNLHSIYQRRLEGLHARLGERKQAMGHPLSNHPDWLFWQPAIEAKGTALLIPDREGSPELHSFWAINTCREGLIYNLAASMRKQVIGWDDPQKKIWERKKKRVARIRLYDPRVRKDLYQANSFTIPTCGLWGVGGRLPEVGASARVDLFLRVCDALVGVPSVLLSKCRPRGDWWKGHGRFHRNGGREYVFWAGTDNWFMRHPALTAIATGLFRQAHLLVTCGFGEQVLAVVERKEVEAALTEADWKLAYKLALQLRPWIEVPCGKGGIRVNYPFPLGLWRRFDYLQRAVRRHNYKEIFQRDFYRSWGLTGKTITTHGSGTYAVWGDRGGFTDNHLRLRKLGAPRRRSKRGKPAAAGA